MYEQYVSAYTNVLHMNVQSHEFKEVQQNLTHQSALRLLAELNSDSEYLGAPKRTETPPKPIGSPANTDVYDSTESDFPMFTDPSALIDMNATPPIDIFICALNKLRGFARLHRIAPPPISTAEAIAIKDTVHDVIIEQEYPDDIWMQYFPYSPRYAADINASQSPIPIPQAPHIPLLPLPPQTPPAFINMSSGNVNLSSAQLYLLDILNRGPYPTFSL